MVPTPAGEPATAARARHAPRLHAAQAIPAAVFGDLGNRGPLRFEASGGSVPSPDGPAPALVDPSPEEREDTARLGGGMGSVQRDIWGVDGGLPPRRDHPGSGVYEQAARCDGSRLVEDVHATNLAVEREERGPSHAGCDGDEGGDAARGVGQARNVRHTSGQEKHGVPEGEERDVLGCATVGDMAGPVSLQQGAGGPEVPRGLALPAAPESRRLRLCGGRRLGYPF